MDLDLSVLADSEDSAEGREGVSFGSERIPDKMPLDPSRYTASTCGVDGSIVTIREAA